MIPNKAEFDWEILPWRIDDENTSYAIYADTTFRSPMITISNQMDCGETFSLQTVEEIDAFVARLLKARAWLSQQ